MVGLNRNLIDLLMKKHYGERLFFFRSFQYKCLNCLEKCILCYKFVSGSNWMSFVQRGNVCEVILTLSVKK